MKQGTPVNLNTIEVLDLKSEKKQFESYTVISDNSPLIRCAWFIPIFKSSGQITGINK